MVVRHVHAQALRGAALVALRSAGADGLFRDGDGARAPVPGNRRAARHAKAWARSRCVPRSARRPRRPRSGRAAPTTTFPAPKVRPRSSSRSRRDRKVLAVYFTPVGSVDRVAQYGLKDGKVFDYVKNETPNAARDENVLKKLFRNLGSKQLGPRLAGASACRAVIRIAICRGRAHCRSGTIPDGRAAASVRDDGHALSARGRPAAAAPRCW